VKSSLVPGFCNKISPCVQAEGSEIREVIVLEAAEWEGHDSEAGSLGLLGSGRSPVTVEASTWPGHSCSVHVTATIRDNRS